MQAAIFEDDALFSELYAQKYPEVLKEFETIKDLAISWDEKSQNRNDWLDFFLSVARLRLGFGPSKG